MRKWQDLASPDDPGSWYDVGNLWPLQRGCYETADGSTGSTVSSGIATTGAACYAYAFGPDASNGIQEYVATANSGNTTVYSWNGTTKTARVTMGGNTLRGHIQMVRFGSAAIVASAALSKIYAAATFSTDFSEVTGALANSYDCVCTQSDAVLLFNAGTNFWAASDIGDYTNWTTGEAANGTFYQTPGVIACAVPFGANVYVFKTDAIMRMTYVGGTLKWQSEIAWRGMGVPRGNISPQQPTQDWAIATNQGIAFYGGGGKVYLFDGVSAPICLNPFTTIPVETISGVFTYNPSNNTLCIATSYGSSSAGQSYLSASVLSSSLNYYYNFETGAWGNGYGSDSELPDVTLAASGSGVVRGEYANRFESSTKPAFWMGQTIVSSGVSLRRCAPSSPSSTVTSYTHSSLYGRPDFKTHFSRVTPLLRRRTTTGTPVASLQATFFRERHDTSAADTQNISESSTRARFDLLKDENFARFKTTFSGMSVQSDDELVTSKLTSTD